MSTSFLPKPSIYIYIYIIVLKSVGYETYHFITAFWLFLTYIALDSTPKHRHQTASDHAPYKTHERPFQRTLRDNTHGTHAWPNPASQGINVNCIESSFSHIKSSISITHVFLRGHPKANVCFSWHVLAFFAISCYFLGSGSWQPGSQRFETTNRKV